MRLACDTGGTFTDLVVEHADGTVEMFKAPTTPSDPIDGVLDAIRRAADAHGRPLADFLSDVDTLIHGTTHAINAIITGRTAKTAFLTTAGHPDVLLLREGGRGDPFDHELAFPDPYVPRALTFEITGRLDYAGAVLTPLDEAQVLRVIEQLRDLKVEAVACCLLWSISNPDHELKVGALLEKHLPGVPYTLSHQLNPSLREYRRAISAAMDASLKPMMTRYLGSMQQRLRNAGFNGRLMVQTSQGGMADADALAKTPIHSLNSGPAMAPIAGRHIAQSAGISADIIVADTGGTTYDVSLIRQGRIPMTRETWIGRPYEGHMTGFPSVDVKSVGAGGGSIAWLDDAGLLRVGPQSAGAVPGPVCFGRGGGAPTVTDACVALGYIDPDYFLGGVMRLDADAARQAIAARIAGPLNVSVETAALGIYRVATENMVQAILDLTVRQGIDPADTVLIGGGGAAGLNSVKIAQRLGSNTVIIPILGPALSAVGGLLSDIKSYVRRTLFATTAKFDFTAVQACLADLTAQAHAFARSAGVDPATARIEFSMEARYPNQVWEIDVPFARQTIADAADVAHLRSCFHDAHQAIFGFSEPQSEIEIVTWSAAVSCPTDEGGEKALLLRRDSIARAPHSRAAWFEGQDAPVPAQVYDFQSLPPGETLIGPAIIESPFTTVVIDPDAQFTLIPGVGLSVTPARSS